MATPARRIEALRELYDARDYFALRDRLPQPTRREKPDVSLFRAAVQAAFNQAAASNATLHALLARHDLDARLKIDLLQIKRRNEIRLCQYREAAASAATLLAAPQATCEERDDAENERVLLDALTGVPPQQAVRRGASRIPLRANAAGGSCVPVRIGRATHDFMLDTGAGFSVLMQSEAEALGLRVQRLGLQVDASTGAKVVEDVAIIDRLSIGNIDYRHVACLVLPDSALTFPDRNGIPGILGLPVIEAMDEVEFRRDQTIEVPHDVPRRAPSGTLALLGLQLLTQVVFGDERLICRVDTRANRTVFYEPFYRRFKNRIDRAGTRRMAQAGGAGGLRAVPSTRLPAIEVGLAKQAVRLANVDVYRKPMTTARANILFGNIGLDTLRQFDVCRLNFQAMSIVLENRTSGRRSRRLNQ